MEMKILLNEKIAKELRAATERAERAENALLEIGLKTNERSTYEAVAAFYGVKTGGLWDYARARRKASITACIG